jgi:hypothetical protein
MSKVEVLLLRALRFFLLGEYPATELAQFLYIALERMQQKTPPLTVLLLLGAVV